MTSLQFGAALLRIPQAIFDLLQDSVTTTKSENQIRFRDYIQSKQINGQMVVVKREKFLEEYKPIQTNFSGYALNLVVDLLNMGYDYLEKDNQNRHVLHRPGFDLDPEQLVVQGSDLHIPESFIFITDDGTNEKFIYDINEISRMEVVVKLPSGEWISQKKWTREELKTLKYKSLAQPKYLTPKQYLALPSITDAQLDASMDVTIGARDETGPNTVRHIFTAIEESEPGVLRSDIFFNGLRNSEKPFKSYTNYGTNIFKTNLDGPIYDCSFALYNEFAPPANPTDSDYINGIGNMGMVVRKTFAKNDPRALEVRYVADGQQKYDEATNTFHFDPSKNAFFEFSMNALPHTGKEYRAEVWYNPVTKVMSYGIGDMGL